MKTEELYRRVEDVAVAVVPEEEKGEEVWRVYLINFKEEPISNILVNSKGYGEKDERQVKTGTLRQFFDELEPQSFVMIEFISKELFSINNEFWISFWYKDYLYDKKFIFLTDTIIKENLTPIPLVNKSGVMIK